MCSTSNHHLSEVLWIPKMHQNATYLPSHAVRFAVMLSSVVSESQTIFLGHMILCASTQVFQGAELEISGLVSWQLMPALMFYIPATNGLSQTLVPRDSAVSAWCSWAHLNDHLVLWGSMDGQLENPPVSSMMFPLHQQIVHSFGQVQAIFPGVKNRTWNSTPVYPRLYQNVAHFVNNIISRMSSILRQTHINASIWICPSCGFDVASCVQFSILV